MAKYYYNKYNSVYNAGTSARYTENHNWSDLGHTGGLVGYFPSYTFDASTNKYSNSGVAIVQNQWMMPGNTGYYASPDGSKLSRRVVIGDRADYANYVAVQLYEKFATNNTYVPGSSGYYSRGSLVQSNIIAEDGTYPTNGRHSDGSWYVRGALANNAPTVALSTTDNRTLYESDTLGIVGSTTDADAGNVVTVRYSINGGAVRAISTAISTGTAIPFSKSLVFRNMRLYDGDTAITTDLLEGAQHTLKVWAEDDQGGKSAEVTRTFQVVANRAPILTINTLANKSDLINTDTIIINGTVSDPDGNTVKVDYKVGSGSYAEIYDGAGGDFAITLPLSALKVGNNAVAVRATDSYGAVTTRNLNFAKTENLSLLKESVRRYKINPPNREAKGVVLWVERDVGDLIVSAEISMTGNAEDESFEPMTLNSTAFVSATREEDEFQYEASEVKEKIILKLTMVRASLDSDQGIRLISGVLS